MNVDLARSLQNEITASLDLFESTSSEQYQVDAHEKALQLAQVLTRPREAILRLSYSPTTFMAVKVAIDLDVFSVLAQATTPVSLAELAVRREADPQLVERIMRTIVATGFAEQPSPFEYLPNAISREMTQRGPIGMVESLFLEFLPAVQKTPEYLQATKYRNPDDPLHAPLQYAHKFQGDGFTWLCQNPAALSRFNNLMKAQRADRPYWGDWFPVREQILSHPDLCPDQPLLVDIGGGIGHDLILFRDRFPDAPGQLILEDLPSVLDGVHEEQDLDGTAGIQTQIYDFFAQEQPIQNARVYYFKHVLHDWSDEKANIILNNLKPAMKRGYSKIVVEEYIAPDQNAHLIPCMTDLLVMCFCSGLQRTRQRWTDLFTSAGLRILNIWIREGSGLGIIEAELLEDPSNDME